MTERSITCPACGMTSYNSNDVEQGYCGNCHAWTNGTVAGRRSGEVRIISTSSELHKPGR